MQSKPAKKLGEILLDQQFITQDQLDMGIEKQKIAKKRLGEILTELGFVTEEKLAEALSTQLGKPSRMPVPRPPPLFSRRRTSVKFCWSIV